MAFGQWLPHCTARHQSLDGVARRAVVQVLRLAGQAGAGLQPRHQPAAALQLAREVDVPHVLAAADVILGAALHESAAVSRLMGPQVVVDPHARHRHAGRHSTCRGNGIHSGSWSESKWHRAVTCGRRVEVLVLPVHIGQRQRILRDSDVAVDVDLGCTCTIQKAPEVRILHATKGWVSQHGPEGLRVELQQASVEAVGAVVGNAVGTLLEYAAGDDETLPVADAAHQTSLVEELRGTLPVGFMSSGGPAGLEKNVQALDLGELGGLIDRPVVVQCSSRQPQAEGQVPHQPVGVPGVLHISELLAHERHEHVLLLEQLRHIGVHAI
eukprot:11228306-Lingulodinium_polyedra.AAC.2